MSKQLTFNNLTYFKVNDEFIYPEYVRLHTVDKSRKDFKCEISGNIIPKGNTYFWFKTHQYGKRHIFSFPIITKYDLYYLQNGYNGDSMLWWRGPEHINSGAGYTKYIKDASVFTYDGIISQLKCDRGERAWKCSDIDYNHEAKKVVIESYNLNFEKSITNGK